MKKNKIISTTVFVILLFAILAVSIGAPNNISAENLPHLAESSPIMMMNVSTPITIANEVDFQSYASSGDGTNGTPYVLSDFLINGVTHTENLIYIVDTTAFAVISGNELIGGFNGILLNNASNIDIINNKIHGNYQHGIRFIESDNTTVTDNEIYDNGSGCFPRFVNLDLNQIRLATHLGSGMHYDPSDNSVVSGNDIYNNYIDGITIEDATNIVITGNNISNNGNQCTPTTSLSLNDVQSGIHDGFGIDLQTANKITISSNKFVSNANYGIHITDSAINVLVSENVFEHNGFEYEIGKQAYDDNSNTVNANCWDDLGSKSYYELDGADPQTRDIAARDNSECDWTLQENKDRVAESDEDDSALSLYFVIISLFMSGMITKHRSKKQ